MQETRVTKEQAVKLKAAGFDWETRHIWHNHLTQGWIEDEHHDPYPNSSLHSWEYARPTLSRVCYWLREVKGWHVTVFPNGAMWAYFTYRKEDAVYIMYSCKGRHLTHDLALLAGIDEVLGILEKEASNG